MSPHRFELYRGIIHCYLALQRSREAANIAANALHHLGQTPRILTVSCLKICDKFYVID